jgi:DNA-directed RNA polymerase specialized sigma subunit
MTVNPLDLAAHRGYITDEGELARLVAAAQHVPTSIRTETVTDDNGVAQTVAVTFYGTNADAEAALEQLVNAFLPVLHSVAHTSRVLDFDDALMICVESFVSYIRTFDLSSVLPFKAPIRTILSRRLGDTGRASGIIPISPSVHARYRQLMDRHAWNAVDAYRECVETVNALDPDTFLKVSRVIGVDSLDQALLNDDGDDGTPRFEAALADPEPNPEDVTVQAELVRWLFSLVDSDAEQILRLAYGFDDLATENARLAHGYRADGTVLSDREVGHIVGLARLTVGRRRNAALGVMRAALGEDEEAVA